MSLKTKKHCMWQEGGSQRCTKYRWGLVGRRRVGVMEGCVVVYLVSLCSWLGPGGAGFLKEKGYGLAKVIGSR